MHLLVTTESKPRRGIRQEVMRRECQKCKTFDLHHSVSAKHRLHHELLEVRGDNAMISNILNVSRFCVRFLLPGNMTLYILTISSVQAEARVLSKLILLMVAVVGAVFLIEGWDQQTQTFDPNAGVNGIFSAANAIYLFLAASDQWVSIIILLAGATLISARLVASVFSN